MDSNKIRQKFLNFFYNRGHTIVPSSSLLPSDSSVLFTTAGMQQFKLYYLPENFGGLDSQTAIHYNLDKPVGRNAVSVQKCIRTSDINEVGDESHLTFFEMLGNFSFGGYFKKEAIKYAYDFLISEMGIPISKIFVTVFGGDSDVLKDEESVKIWESLGFAEKNGNLHFGGRSDNFWGPTGLDGPCGPTTEIYAKNIEGKEVEIWNIVFNEYFCDRNKKLMPLKSLGIDTGMGLERLAMIVQNKKNIFDTDLFEPIIKELEKISKLSYLKNQRIFRIIADHLKASVFIISENIMPSNIERGYILRRLLRRVIRYAKLLNLKDNFYISIIKIVGEIYKEIYPEIKNKETEILTVIQNEEEKFLKTLELGLKKIKNLEEKRGKDFFEKGKDNFKNIRDLKYKDLAKEIFNLYQNYGFPLELSIEELKSIGVKNIDEDKLKKLFFKEFEKHQEVSRVGAEKKFGGHGLILDTGELKASNQEEVEKITKLHTLTHMLQAALRKILGNSVRQMGSDITAERLRFDFNFERKLTNEEIKKIENLINEKIKEELIVEKKEMPYAQAIKEGALSFFKGRYPEIVSVYTIFNPKIKEIFSQEVCGGPHVKNTKEIKGFRILKEESVAAGIRRIKAIEEIK